MPSALEQQCPIIAAPLEGILGEPCQVVGSDRDPEKIASGAPSIVCREIFYFLNYRR
jgi:hypothetical protein